MLGAIERLFRLRAHGTHIGVELRAGLTTFLTLAYIIVVNPGILADAGMPFDGALFATCIAAAVATLLMGLLANYPFALAPGMGLNAYFAYEVVLRMGVPWQTALGAVFLSGLAFVALTVGRVRAVVVDAIPGTLKIATAGGIGLFIAFIGLRNAGIVVAHPATYLTLGPVTSPPALLALSGLVLTAALMARRLRSGILLGIVAVTAVAMATGVSPLPAGLVSVPDPGGTFLQLDIGGALALGLLDIVFVFLFVDLFDTVGTFVALAEEGGFTDKQGRIPRVNRALLADSTGSVVGALFGTSTVTTYIESSTGIAEGGRTGLTAVVVAALFVLATFFSPVLAAIPPFATAPALIVVGALMMRSVVRVKWDDLTEAVPAFVTMLAMPLTFSIANGLAFGFVTWPLVKLLTGRAREVGWVVWLLAALFVVRYAFVAGG